MGNKSSSKPKFDGKVSVLDANARPDSPEPFLRLHLVYFTATVRPGWMLMVSCIFIWLTGQVSPRWLGRLRVALAAGRAGVRELAYRRANSLDSAAPGQARRRRIGRFGRARRGRATRLRHCFPPGGTSSSSHQWASVERQGQPSWCQSMLGVPIADGIVG